jgi:hypothetical protein
MTGVGSTRGRILPFLSRSPHVPCHSTRHSLLLMLPHLVHYFLLLIKLLPALLLLLLLLLLLMLLLLLLLLLMWWSGIPFTNIVAGGPADFWKQSSGCRVKARPAVFCCSNVVGGIGICADAYELNVKFVGCCALLSSYVERHLPHEAVHK